MFSHGPGAKDLTRRDHSHLSAIDCSSCYQHTSRIVAKWNVAPIVSVFMLGILMLIGLIQVLPQVDLPDTAFHEDTAPVVMKFRIAAAPVIVSAIATLGTQLSAPTNIVWNVLSLRPSRISGNLVPILHCSLLC